jgi:SAM-dependent methyltransferase
MSALPRIYLAYQQLVFPACARKEYLSTYVKATPNDDILDLGCGPGTFLPYLDYKNYLGVDLDPDSILYAQEKYKSRQNTHFIIAPAQSFKLPDVYSETRFDIALSNGLIHHLDDSTAIEMLEKAKKSLTDSGRFVSFDPVFVNNQHWLSRFVTRCDRGRFVRTPNQYKIIASQVFKDVTVSIEKNYLRFPYDLIIMSCKN